MRRVWSTFSRRFGGRHRHCSFSTGWLANWARWAPTRGCRSSTPSRMTLRESSQCDGAPSNRRSQRWQRSERRVPGVPGALSSSVVIDLADVPRDVENGGGVGPGLPRGCGCQSSRPQGGPECRTIELAYRRVVGSWSFVVLLTTRETFAQAAAWANVSKSTVWEWVARWRAATPSPADLAVVSPGALESSAPLAGQGAGGGGGPDL